MSKKINPGFIVLSVLCLEGTFVPAVAQPARIHLHQTAWTAHAPETADTVVPANTAGPTHAASCYVSLSPADAGRGVRYWTGNC